MMENLGIAPMKLGMDGKHFNFENAIIINMLNK